MPELERRFACSWTCGCRGRRVSTCKQAVFDRVVAGELNKQIAGALGIAERTVKLQRAQLMTKLGASSAAELGRLAERLQQLPD